LKNGVLFGFFFDEISIKYGVNVIKPFSAVIYCHSTVIVILCYETVFITLAPDKKIPNTVVNYSHILTIENVSIAVIYNCTDIFYNIGRWVI
jgi:hypothetical protein